MLHTEPRTSLMDNLSESIIFQTFTIQAIPFLDYISLQQFQTPYFQERELVKFIILEEDAKIHEVSENMEFKFYIQFSETKKTEYRFEIRRLEPDYSGFVTLECDLIEWREANV